MKPGQLIGLLVGGVGLYWLLEQMGVVPCVFACTASAGGTVTASAGTPVASSGAGTATTGPAAGVTVMNTITQVKNKMLAAGDDPTQNHSVYAFNYYYQQVTGVPGPDPAKVLPGDPNADNHLVDINTWWAGMQAAGFSGFGMIGANVARYTYPFGRFANYLQLTGGEKLIKRMD